MAGSLQSLANILTTAGAPPELLAFNNACGSLFSAGLISIDMGSQIAAASWDGFMDLIDENGGPPEMKAQYEKLIGLIRAAAEG